MLELNIKCADAEEAHIYLNAPQYLNLIVDFTEAIRNATKHGTEKDILKQVQSFYSEMLRVVEHHTGAY